MDPGGSALNEPREVNLPGRLAQFEGSFPPGYFSDWAIITKRGEEATLRAEDNVAGFELDNRFPLQNGRSTSMDRRDRPPDRWQIGGYSRPTTLLESTPNVVWFTDMVTRGH